MQMPGAKAALSTASRCAFALCVVWLGLADPVSAPGAGAGLDDVGDVADVVLLVRVGVLFVAQDDRADGDRRECGAPRAVGGVGASNARVPLCCLLQRFVYPLQCASHASGWDYALCARTRGSCVHT